MMGKRRAESEAQESAYQAPPMQAPPMQAPPPQSGGVTSDDMARLQDLGRLHEQGILSDEEFAQQKAAILGTG